MNIDRIISMVINQIVRTFVRKGVSAGMSQANKLVQPKKNSQTIMTPEEQAEIDAQQRERERVRAIRQARRANRD